MKRFAVVGVAVVSSVASVGSSPVSAAANPSSAVVDCNAGTGNLASRVKWETRLTSPTLPVVRLVR